MMHTQSVTFSHHNTPPLPPIRYFLQCVQRCQEGRILLNQGHTLSNTRASITQLNPFKCPATLHNSQQPSSAQQPAAHSLNHPVKPLHNFNEPQQPSSSFDIPTTLNIPQDPFNTG